MVHLLREIEKLKKKITILSSLVENMLRNSIRAIVNREIALAEETIKADIEINQMEVEIEEECLKMLALYQPVAVDLRFIVAILKINNDLERVGDLAKNIAKSAIRVNQKPLVDDQMNLNFENLAQKTFDMFKEAIDSLIDFNYEKARQICATDDVIDDMVHSALETIIKEIKVHPDKTELLLQYIFVFRHLERIADLATNIAEDTIYMKEGNIIRHGS